MLKQVMPVLMIVLLVFGATPSFLSHQISKQETTELPNDRGPLYWLVLKQNTKINGEIIPENITILEIPSKNIQYNMIISSNITRGLDIHFIVKDIQEWQITPVNTYYNSTLGTTVFRVIDNQPYTDFYVTNNYQIPTKISDYFFSPLDKLLTMIKEQEINVPQLISNFGKGSIITFIIDNGTEFFPTIGPENSEYYYNIHEQQKYFEQELKSYNNGVSINVSSKMTWKIVQGKNAISSVDPPQAPFTRYNNSIFLSIKNPDYDLKMFTSQALQFEKHTLNYISFHNEIYYLNKSNNTVLEINNLWDLQKMSLTVNNDSVNSSTENASFPFFSSFIGLLVIIPLIRFIISLKKPFRK